MAEETSMFDQPAAAGSFPLEEHLGHLLLIWPQELKKDIATVYGASDAISCRIAVVEGHDAGEEFENVLLFPRVLVSTLTAGVGKGRPVLGRLGQGTAKQGQSKPWVLDSFTDADAAKAAAFLNSQFSKPTAEPEQKWADKAPSNPEATTQATQASAGFPVLTEASRTLAIQLAATPGVPAATVAQAAGTTVEHLLSIGILNESQV